MGDESLRSHLSLAVHSVGAGEHLAELEKRVVDSLQPPLRLEHVPACPLRECLRELRAVVVHGIDDLWAAPDPALADWRGIRVEHGQACNDCRSARLMRRRERSKVLDEVLRRPQRKDEAAPISP